MDDLAAYIAEVERRVAGGELPVRDRDLIGAIPQLAGPDEIGRLAKLRTEHMRRWAEEVKRLAETHLVDFIAVADRNNLLAAHYVDVANGFEPIRKYTRCRPDGRGTLATDIAAQLKRLARRHRHETEITDFICSGAHRITNLDKTTVFDEIWMLPAEGMLMKFPAGRILVLDGEMVSVIPNGRRSGERITGEVYAK